MSSQSPLGTSQLLDYYHSPLADSTLTAQLNNDKRRLAVIELDSQPPSSLLARRRANASGTLDHSVLLVAPPDASPSSYSKLSPPEALSAEQVIHVTEKGKSSPRDIGIVGLTPVDSSPSSTPRSPVFQTSLSPSHSSFPSQHNSPITPSSLANHLLPPFDKSPSSGITTPAIGQEKDPMAKVAGPVLVGLALDDSGFAIGTVDMDPTRARSGQHALPGVPNASTHSGVLSPPPRPPRRTKDSPPSTSPAITPGKLQRPDSDYSSVAVSGSTSDNLETATSRSSSAAPKEEGQMESTAISHKREGAFPPSTFLHHNKLSDPARPQRTPSPSPIPLDIDATPTAPGRGRAARTAEDETPGTQHTLPIRPALKSRFSSFDTHYSDGVSAPNSNGRSAAQSPIEDAHVPSSPKKEKVETSVMASSSAVSVSSSLENFTLQVGEAIDNLGLAKSTRPLPAVSPSAEVNSTGIENRLAESRSRERSRSPTKLVAASTLTSPQTALPPPHIRSAFSHKYRQSQDGAQLPRHPPTSPTMVTGFDIASPWNQNSPPSSFPSVKETKRASQPPPDRRSLDQETSSISTASLKSKIKRASTMSASGLGVGSPPKDSPPKRDDRRLSSSSGNSGGGLRRRLSLGSRHSASSTSSMVINSVLGSLGMGDKSKEKERDRSSGSSDNQQLRPPSLDSGVRSKRSSRSPSMRLSGLQPQRVSPHSFNSKMDPIPPVPRLPPSPTHTTKTSASNLKPKPGYRRDPVTGEIIKFHIGIVSSWPEALVSFDVPKKKTSLERCQGYAKKMTQLLEEESGLGEWVESVKYRGRPARRDTIRSSPSDRFVSPSSPVSAGFNGRFQTRHVSGGSGGSVMTEVTFPVRPMDAYVATDLPVRASDSTINGPPANLPFPGLFQQQAKGVFSSSGSGLKPSASVRTFIKAAGGSNGSSGGTGLGLTGAPQSNSLKGPQAPAPTGKNGSNSGSNGSSGGGFFASIGRKASISMSKPTILTTVMKAASNNPAPLALPSPPAPSTFPISGNPMSPVRSRSMVAGLGGHVQRVTGGPRPLPSANSKQQQAPITHRSTPSRASTILIIGRKSNESGSDGSNHKTRRVLSPDIENDAATESDVGALPVFPKVPTKTTHQPLGPRPSLSYRTSVKSNTTLGEDARAVLNTNLEKLGDLLPYVDRPTLSLYLNKAGGDDLKAIGMYLEDEKRGMVMSK